MVQESGIFRTCDFKRNSGYNFKSNHIFTSKVLRSWFDKRAGSVSELHGEGKCHTEGPSSDLGNRYPRKDVLGTPDICLGEGENPSCVSQVQSGAVLLGCHTRRDTHSAASTVRFDPIFGLRVWDENQAP